VDLPVFIFELKDFPRMLRDMGRVLSKGIKPSDAAGGYIAYSFGWAPLISDLKKLVDFSAHIDQRIRSFRKLEVKAKQGGSLGTVQTRSSEILREVMIPSYWVTKPIYKGKIVCNEERRHWYTARAELLTALPSNAEDERLLAAKAAFGLNLSAASLWEATPWSWLIDYLSNVGDYLDASRGFIPWKCTSICLMTHSKQTITLQLEETHPGITVSSGSFLNERKARTVVANPTPSIHFDPLFTNHQVGILTSLVTSNALRGVGK
jgi:hypothetical protein